METVKVVSMGRDRADEVESWDWAGTEERKLETLRDKVWEV
jgi:hypothetical protein